VLKKGFTLISMLALLPVNSFAEDDIGKSAEEVPAVIIAAQEVDADPLEGFNRGVYKFNETVDNILLEPVARTYRAAIPKWGRERVGNALNNLSSPVVFANSVLQGDVDQSFATFWRFVINSTLGVGGLFDVAKEAGLKPRKEDFGQTIGKYGVGSGPYIVLPFIGPTTARDAVGKAVDSISNPFNYLTPAAVVTINTVDVVDEREGLLDTIDEIEETSFDPYSTIRSAYIQHRANLIRNGEGSSEKENWGSK